MMVTVCGLPGVGKTTVAERIAKRLEAAILKTNDIRAELFPTPQWTPEEFQAVYDELFASAKTILAQGLPLILDGTFVKQKNRDRVRALAADRGVKCTLVLVTCDEQIVRERIEQRQRDDSNGAPYWAYEQFKSFLEPVTEKHVVIENNESIAQLDKTLSALFP